MRLLPSNRDSTALFLRGLVSVGLLLAIASSQAGTQAIREVKYNFRQIAALAKGVERNLAQRRVRVAVIGRVDRVATARPTIVRPRWRFSWRTWTFIGFTRLSHSTDYRYCEGGETR